MSDRDRLSVPENMPTYTALERAGCLLTDPIARHVPRVVKKRIKDEIERRFAVIAAAEENAKAQVALLYQCTDAQLHHLVSSAERAELLAAAAMTNCSREIAAAIHAIIEALRAKSGIDEAEIGNVRLHARNNFHTEVLARAVQLRADRGSSPARPAPPAQSAPTPSETAGRNRSVPELVSSYLSKVTS